jgi:hypothetical protein
VDRFNREYAVDLVLDAENCRIQVDDMIVSDFNQRLNGGVPTEDIGIAVLGPWSVDRKHRMILCGGLSTYGTEAAARFIFNDVNRDRKLRRRLRKLVNSNDAVVIGVHAFIEARSVQETSIMSVGGREMIWTGSRVRHPT